MLTLTGIAVKVMGAIYRIPLSRLIGEEGMGLYQMAYPVYLVFLSVSTAGLPVAISKLVAEGVAKGDLNGIRRLFNVSFSLLSIMGLAGSLLMGFGSPLFSQSLSTDPRSMLSMIALAPSVTLMAMISALRGYFQGWQHMRPSGLSQLFEQGTRVLVLIFLALLFLPKGIEWAAAGAAFGATVGAFVALIYLMIKFLCFRRTLKGKIQSGGKAGGSYPMWLKRLIKIALPIALGSILMPLMQALDSLIVPGKLQLAGLTISQATAALGQLGNAWAVLYVPLIVTSALSTGLVPAIAEAKARRSQGSIAERLREGYRLASWVLPAASLGLVILGKDIYALIFAGRSTVILQTLGIGVFFLGWQQVSAAVLQGMGRPMDPLRHFALGCVVKAIVTFVLVGRPHLGIHGAAIATVVGSAATVTLNLNAIRHLTKFKGWISAQAIPFLSAVVMGTVGLCLRSLCSKLPSNLSALFMLIVMSGVYLLVLWGFGGINRTDLEGFRRHTKNSA